MHRLFHLRRLWLPHHPRLPLLLLHRNQRLLQLPLKRHKPMRLRLPPRLLHRLAA
jgi:hypothetical protein